MYKFLLLFLLFFLLALPAHAGLLSCQDNCTFCDLLQTGNNILKFTMELALILVVGMIVYGGFTVMTAGGNSGTYEKGIGSIKTAVFGVGIVLLAWVFVSELLNVLAGNGLTVPWYEISCESAPQEFNSDWSAFKASGGNFSYPTTQSSYNPPASENCKNIESMANYYGVPSSPTIAPELSNMINCIETKLKEKGKYNLVDEGQIYTYQRSNDTRCNYTRGLPVCGITSCAHKNYSCHYGGVNGSFGALGVDFNAGSNSQEQSLYNAIKSIYDSGSCIGMSAPINEDTHTHVSHSSCNSGY